MPRCLGCMETYEEKYDICPHCGYVRGTSAEEAIHMEPGSMLANRYLVGKVLGFGGFGVTYLGYDGKLGQKVAIKEYLPSEFATRMPGSTMVTVFEGDKNAQFKDGMVKFVDEAKRLAKFQNESGIVQVMDSFIENETAYIIMELLEGETLAEKLKREGTIPEYEAVQLLMPVMMSLSIIHKEGLLHRDISPDNIFLTKDGQVKLIDFGASRFATTSHSRSLTVIIKPGYSPEEQYRSRGDQGPWTDVYALGACLYKMITGKTPPDAMERRAKFETKNQDILTLPSRLTKKVSAIHENAILNAMNVRIEDRTPDVQTLMDELLSDSIVKRKNGRIKKIDVYRWPLWFKISAAIIVLAILSTGTLMATGVIKVASLFSDTVVIPDGMVSIPDVSTISITKATRLAENKKMTVAIAGSVTSPYVEAGKIVYQEPKSGLICDEYSVLSLYVSKGNGEIIKPVDGTSTVPYLIGSTVDEAKSDLNEAGLAEPQLVYEYDENIAEGLVMQQSKNYGAQMDEGSIITLTVSKGSAPFELANLYLMNKADVDSMYKQKGLQIVYTEKETSEFADGRVLSQDVPAGTMVRKLDTINLVVAKSAWSEWSIDAPNDVSGKEIDTKTQYSYSDYVDLPWSKWSTEKVVESSSRTVETTLEYRYRNKEYVESEKTSLEGYQIVSTTPVRYGEWKKWSSWSKDEVSETDTRDVESKMQYRYKKKNIQSSSTALAQESGWKLIDTTYTEWGTEQQIEKAKNDVLTESETLRINQKRDYYFYQHYCYYNDAKNRNIDGCIGVCYADSWDNPLSFYGNSSYDGSPYYRGAKCPRRWEAYWLVSESVFYTYQTRSVTYKYEKYDDNWSKWSDSDDAPSGALKDNQIVWRHRERDPIFSFWKWSTWSDWSTTKVDYKNDKDVESRPIYRYSDKYWTDYSEFADAEISESTTRKVQKRTMYRYKTID